MDFVGFTLLLQITIIYLEIVERRGCALHTLDDSSAAGHVLHWADVLSSVGIHMVTGRVLYIVCCILGA